MTDESTWRSAFLYHFHDLPLNRINTLSWRKEYLHRIDIELGWKQSQNHLMIDPRIMGLDRIQMIQDGIAIGSLSSGTIINCDPRTGKLSRFVLNVSETSDPMRVGAMEFQ
jgi:hypothetical protein